MRPRVAALVALVFLAFAFLAVRAGADEGSPCLSSHVGEVLSARLAAHAFDGALPAGWKLGEVSVDRDHIDLGVLDAQGRLRGVTLRPRGKITGAVDGQGRSFVFVIDAGGAPLDSAGKDGLLDLAARVDVALPEDDALRLCTTGKESSAGSAGPDVHAASSGWARYGGMFPRWVALSVGVLEVIVILGALAFARCSRRDAPAMAFARDSVWLDLAVFVLAWLALHAWGGASPSLWLDTFNDQRDVRQCLTQGACTSLGEATSVDGVHHAVGWLDFLGLAAFMGFGLGPLHVMFQALSAFGVMLAGSTTRQAWGRSIGLCASLECLDFMRQAVNEHALYNTTPLPFLGAVFLLVGVAAVTRPGVASIVLTALVGAVLASVHSACVVSVLSVMWVAFLAPRHRVKLAALGAVVFVATALAIGPAAWISSAHHVLHVATGPGGVHRTTFGGTVAALASYGTLIALALTARLLTRPDRRRVVDVALAIAVPMLAASFAAAAVSSVPTNAKYLAHIAPSGGVLVAALVAALSARISGVHARVGRVALVVPVLLYTTIPGAFAWLGAGPDQSLTFHEAAAIPRELAARGWNYAQVYRSLRSPRSTEILASFDLLAPGFPVGAAPDDPTVVYIAKIDTTAVPKPLPERWVIASQDRDTTVVLVFVKSFLSWEHFAACDPRAAQGQDTCAPSGLSVASNAKPVCVYCVPGMPPFNRPGVRPFELRMTAKGAPGEAHAIVMPLARPQLCAGSIASAPAGPASISADQRRSTWIEPIGGSLPQEVRLDWTIGSSDCPMSDYSGLPPFFLEGDPKTVEQLEHLFL